MHNPGRGSLFAKDCPGKQWGDCSTKTDAHLTRNERGMAFSLLRWGTHQKVQRPNTFLLILWSGGISHVGPFFGGMAALSLVFWSTPLAKMLWCSLDLLHGQHSLLQRLVFGVSCAQVWRVPIRLSASPSRWRVAAAFYASAFPLHQIRRRQWPRRLVRSLLRSPGRIRLPQGGAT